LTLLIIFGFVHIYFGQAQSALAIAGLRQYWASSFPPVGNPLPLLSWLLAAHTGSAFAYPGGGARGASTLTFLATLLGVSTLLRRGDRAVVICLTAPFGLAFLAAALKLYPYGSEARLMQFAAPSICLLAGLGAATVSTSIRRVRLRLIVLQMGFVSLIAFGVAPQILSFHYPYRMLYDHQEREFARRFWVEQSRDAKLACAHLDYDLDQNGLWQARKAWYLANQMIYRPREARDHAVREEQVSRDRPLRCVVYEAAPETPAVRSWLDRMKSAYKLRGMTAIEVNVTRGEGTPAIETWRLFEFLPKGDDHPAVLATQSTAAQVFH
jgi:hypothetical protein